jgi:hypothetical protein
MTLIKELTTNFINIMIQNITLQKRIPYDTKLGLMKPYLDVIVLSTTESARWQKLYSLVVVKRKDILWTTCFAFFLICFLEVMFDNIVMAIRCFDNIGMGFVSNTLISRWIWIVVKVMLWFFLRRMFIMELGDS